MTASAKLTWGESAFGARMNASRPADPRLRPLFARDPVGFAARSGAPGEWLMPPTPTVTIIINFADPLHGLPPAFVAGVDDGPNPVRHGATTDCLDLKLTPLGAYRLLGVPMSEIAGRVVEIGDILGPEGRRLAAMPAESPGRRGRSRGSGDPPHGDGAVAWGHRFDLLDRFLVRRAAAGPAPSGPVAWAWRRLVATGGLVPVGELAAAVGWSRRHLTERFRREAGLTPKAMARLIRFSRLLGRVAATGRVRWERLAAECGYYDQSHLNRDFREFLGTTPTDYLSRRPPGGSLAGDGAAQGDGARALSAG